MTELIPAPWSVNYDEDSGCTCVAGPNRFPILLAEMDSSDSGAVCLAAAHFAALARNAYDIQIRRGWTANKSDQGWWVDASYDGSDDGDNWHPDSFQEWLDGRFWDCPLKAMVEADKWHRENCEAKP